MNPYYVSDSLGNTVIDSMRVVDRFGEYTKLADISTVTPGGALRASHICSSGYFELHFFDGAGAPFFNDPSATQRSQARREAVCKVYEDISKLIIPANDPCSPFLPPTVRIWITSTNGASASYPLASATPYHLFPNGSAQVFMPTFRSSGILDNEVWKTINGGVDSYKHLATFGFPPGTYFHGKMTFHIDPASRPGAFPGADWWEIDCANLTYPPLQIPQTFGDFDLYEVALHEAIHLLGFYTLMNTATGTSRISWPFSGALTKFYSRFDEHLYKPSKQTYLMVNADNCYDTRFNNPPLINIDLYNLNPPYPNCQNHIKFFGSNLVNVYTSSASGSSLSHIDQNCYGGSPNDQYIMRPAIYYNGYAFGIRYPHLDEVKMLSDLDYRVRNEYGSFGFRHTHHVYDFGGPTVMGSRIAGVNDFFSPSCSSNPMVVNCLNNLNISHILNNDENAVSFDCLESVFGTGIASPTTGTGGSTITYTPNGGFSGMEILSYIPIDVNGKRGNITYVFIRVECGLPDPCDIGVNGNCNLIPYGDFESLMDVHCSPLNAAVFSPSQLNNSPDLYENGGWLAGVVGTTNPPPTTASFSSCGRLSIPFPSQGTKHVGMLDGSEGLVFELCQALNPGSNYELTFDARLHCTSGTSAIRVLGTDNRPCIVPDVLCSFSNSLPCSNICSDNTIVNVSSLGTIPINGGSSWQPYTAMITGSNASFIVFQPWNPISNAGNYIYLDNVILREVPSVLVTLTATTINSSVCPGDVVNVSVKACLPLPLPYISPAGITVRSTLPTGFTPINGNGWIQYGAPNEAIYILYSGDFDPSTGCATIPNIQIQTPLMAGNGTYSVDFNTDGWGCVAGGISTATFDIYKPTFMTKTASTPYPQVGMPFTYTIEVCNISSTPQNNIFVEDVLDPRLLFIGSPDFTINGNLLTSRNFSLPPGTINNPSCEVLTFEVEPDAPCEVISNCANLVDGSCSDQACVDVIPVNAQMTIMGPTTSMAVGPIPPGSDLFIDGLFTINDPNYMFDGLNITMGPGAQIELPNNPGNPHILAISNSHLHGCTELWDGIYVDGEENVVIIQNTSLIEDAHNSVVSRNGGRYEINNSTFNANHIHVLVEPFANHHQGSINDCQLICDRTLLVPLAGQETITGIEINEVEYIHIGTNNHFENLRYGIDIDRSSVDIDGNDFLDIFEQNNIWAHAAAIYARGVDQNLPPAVDCNGGNPTPRTMPRLYVSGNNIDLCHKGIEVQGHFNTEITGLNTISSMLLTGVHVWADHSPIGNEITIEGNAFNGSLVGGIAVFDMDYSDVSIRDNELTDTYGFGIALQSASLVDIFIAPPPQNVCFLRDAEVIRGNTITNSVEGIRVQNLHNVHITENNIETGTGWSPLGNNMRGIITENNVSLEMHYNEVTNNINTIPSQDQYRHLGIFSNINNGVNMSCNDVWEAGDAIRFDGTNFSTHFVGNKMTDSRIGLHLSNNGLIWHQPVQPSPPFSSVNDNEWIGTFGHSQTRSSNSTLGNLSPFFVRSGNTFFPTNHSSDGSPLIPFSAISNPTVTHSCIPPFLLLRTASEIEQAATLSPTTTANELRQRQLYTWIMLDSIPWDGDSLLTGFKDSCDYSNAGKFIQIGKYVMQNHLPLAWVLNEQVDPGNSLVDGHEQSVNRVLLEMKLANQSYPNQDQRNLLHEIASQCVTEGGSAVLRARHLLQKYQLFSMGDSSEWQHYVDTCVSNSRFMQSIESKEVTAGQKEWSLMAYPNPSGNSFQLQYEIDDALWTYELWSSKGQKIIQKTLDSNTDAIRITTTELTEGLYIGLWKRNGKIMKSHRQLIMK